MRDISSKKEIERDIKPNTITHIDVEENNDGFVVVNDVEFKIENV